MDGLQSGAKGDEGAAQQQPGPQDDQAQQAASQVTGAGDCGAAGGAGGAASGTAATGAGNTAKARTNYEAALKERDERIAALEGEIAEAAKTAESAEKLRAEMDELRKQGEEQRVGFELQMAGARNVKAAKALLADYDNDVDKLKVGEPWLFGTGTAAPRRGQPACRTWALPRTRECSSSAGAAAPAFPRTRSSESWPIRLHT